ncbi:nuclear transport factor 2 family protein [Thermaurantiacus sp.]
MTDGTEQPRGAGSDPQCHDRQAIRALNEAYCDAVNRRDADDWAALWAEDAVWDLAGTRVEGREAIVALWKQAMAGYAFVGFFAQMGPIRIDGDVAEARVWTHEWLEGVDGSERRPLGRYEDRYVKRDGRWLFAERRFTIRRG